MVIALGISVSAKEGYLSKINDVLTPETNPMSPADRRDAENSKVIGNAAPTQQPVATP